MPRIYPPPFRKEGNTEWKQDDLVGLRAVALSFRDAQDRFDTYCDNNHLDPMKVMLERYRNGERKKRKAPVWLDTLKCTESSSDLDTPASPNSFEEAELMMNAMTSLISTHTDLVETKKMSELQVWNEWAKIACSTPDCVTSDFCTAQDVCSQNPDLLSSPNVDMSSP